MDNRSSQQRDRQRIQWAIATVDALIGKQINAILQHSRFQQLEASWRGLDYLAQQIADYTDPRIKLKVLTVSWSELSKDLTRAVEFDQSQFFLKIYNNEFGQPGGEPFGLLVGDYYISHRQNKNQPGSDVATLQAIAKVAAAAFAPFIAAAKPALFGLDEFTGMERPINLYSTFQQAEYQQWKALREDEDARFIGLVAPQVLMRLPYTEQNAIRHPFCFSEDSASSIQRGYLWGNPVYCFAAITARAFSESGWFADIRGKPGNANSSGVVSDLPRHRFSTDASNFAIKYATNVCITERQEKNLNDFGFIALCDNPYADLTAFYACPSLQKPQHYDRDKATENARLSSMLHYMLCVSRFAHYLKIIARDKIGSFTTPQECESYLQNWLRQYTAASSTISAELKAKYPLREARVQVHEGIGSPGKYLCTIHLCPHYQFDQVDSYLQLKTELIRSS